MDNYTVIGYWNEEGQRHVIGVVAGNLNVQGGVDPEDSQGLFAEVVAAEDHDVAEDMVHGTTDEVEF